MNLDFQVLIRYAFPLKHAQPIDNARVAGFTFLQNIQNPTDNLINRRTRNVQLAHFSFLRLNRFNKTNINDFRLKILPQL